MELKLYSTKDGENVLNKSLVLKHTMKIKLKSIVNVSNPEIILAFNPNINLMVCNYAYLDGFLRYYFIRDIEILTDNTCRISLECDVLESFKDDILNSFGEYRRKIKSGDYQTLSIVNDVRKENELFESDIELMDNKNIILSTIGGDV